MTAYVKYILADRATQILTDASVAIGYNPIAQYRLRHISKAVKASQRIWNFGGSI